MKTVFIFDSLGEEPIKFHVADGDYQHFDGVYINLMGDSKYSVAAGELCDYVYDDNGSEKIIFVNDFPYQAVKDGAVVVVCGFHP